MKIDDLIATLQRAREAKGNVEVVFGSFCGTNNGHVCFQLESVRKKFCVDNHMNGLGQLSLSITVSESSQKQILDGRAQMKEIGYDFIPSQFRQRNEQLTKNPPTHLTFCIA